MRYRILDLVLLLSLLPFLIPITILISIYLLLKIGRPILFVQNRAGKYGKPFKLYKFRTMANLDGFQKEKMNNNISYNEFERSRVLKSTKFLRKTRLDEIPQLLNILFNDISFVGPRPLLLEYNSLYNSTQKTNIDFSDDNFQSKCLKLLHKEFYHDKTYNSDGVVVHNSGVDDIEIGINNEN